MEEKRVIRKKVTVKPDVTEDPSEKTVDLEIGNVQGKVERLEAVNMADLLKSQKIIAENTRKAGLEPAPIVRTRSPQRLPIANK